MNNILILTQPDDLHAIAVKLALQEKGYDATLCYSGDFPEMQSHLLKFQDGEIKWRSDGIEANLNHEKIGIVWNRRLGKPIIPEYVHPDDLTNAAKEAEMFYLSLWQTVLSKAIWINPLDKQKRANIKSYQLKIANEVGIKIPETVMTNDPDQIKEFIQSNESSGCIYKTLLPLVWFENDYTAMVYTRKIKEYELPDDQILKSVPGIFQRNIEKLYEIRVVYFGDEYIAVKIDSQKHPNGIMDWRYVPTHELLLEQVYLPIEVDRKCQLLMWRMGLLFGCMDFIVTPEGEYYFLEINEQGQFLWIERVNQDIPILDTFTNFLIGKSEIQRTKRGSPSVSLLQLDSEIEWYIERAIKNHKGSSLVRPHA